MSAASVLQVDQDGFRLDGEPFRIISGGLHYFRVHPELWADRLRKARLMGLNTIETYVPWNLHQPRPDRFDLSGGLDLPRFLDLAAGEGLRVLLRPSPYICAEWEGGGLPSWLLTIPEIRLRSSDARFLAAVSAYYDQLLPPLLTHLSTHGGPILAMQVENEFGAYGEDPDYLGYLAQALREGGVDVPLFTSDQPNDLLRGSIPGVLSTANFGSRAPEGLAALRAHQPFGPLMCAEFWIGWFDRWGGVHVVRDPADAARSLEELLEAGASVNFYMFHGGTNFGFTNGANDKHSYRPIVTSYDYDAPLDEAGDPTAKYVAFQKVIAKYAPVPEAPIPAPAPKLSHPGIALTEGAPLFDQLDGLAATPTEAARPLTMEELGQNFGFVLYETALESAGTALLEIELVRDRAQVFVDGQPVGTLERELHEHAITFQVPRAGAVLRILVENQGRVDYGPALPDRKGLLGAVTLNGAATGRWRCWPLPLEDLSGLRFAPAAWAEGAGAAGVIVGPAFYRGTVEIDAPADTFLTPTGWTKGNAWINGFNLGRYWSRGPQGSLYVPGPVLRRGSNEIVLLELHAAPGPRTIDLRDAPDLGPVEE